MTAQTVGIKHFEVRNMDLSIAVLVMGLLAVPALAGILRLITETRLMVHLPDDLEVDEDVEDYD